MLQPIRAGAFWVMVVVMFAPAATRAQAQPLLPAATERGSATAPVTIIEFSDFECPFCARMPAVLDQLFQNNPDKIHLIFKHSPLPIHPASPLAHEAALAAAAQGKFWAMHDLLFSNQAHLQPADLSRYAVQLGLDPKRFSLALESREYRPAVIRDLNEAAGLGVDGTPTFFVNGRRLIGAQTLAGLQAAVDSALGLGPRMTSTDITPERLNVEGAFVRGSAAAPISIVEFSDLQCPFCARANQTVAELLARYEGQVKLVFKHFPLDMHVNAPLAHRAALAAGQQGKFWEMHDALFADQSLATRGGVTAVAKRLGLDASRFEADMATERFADIIERDKGEGAALGIDGTPTFFIDGVRIVGAQPLASFTTVIERQLLSRSGLLSAPFRSIGRADAPLAITWFGDLRSPLNVDASRLVKQLVAAYPTQVRVTFKHAPLADRDESVVAYDSVLAAGAQGRFWEMYDLLMANPSANQPAELQALAARLGLDVTRFKDDVTARRYQPTADSDRMDAKSLGITGTPAFVIDGERIDGLVALEEFKDIVDRYLQRPPQNPKP